MGLVKVQSIRNKLRLQVPSQTAREIGKRHIYLGLSDNERNKEIADERAKTLEYDILHNCIDYSLDRYTKGLIIKKQPNAKEKRQYQDLISLSKDYLENKRLSAKSSTYNNEKYLIDFLGRCPKTQVKDFLFIRKWLLENSTPLMTKKILAVCSRICKFSIKKGVLIDNPFDGLGNELKVKRKANEEKIQPYSLEEMNEVISYLKENYPKVAGFIEFLFLTGCRPSEAVALKWSDYKPDKKTLSINKAITFSQDKYNFEDSTKTGKDRVFPVGDRLENLLDRLKANSDGDYIVGRMGTYFKYGSFSNKPWRGIQKRMVEDGIVNQIRSLYQCRHTFGSLSEKQGIPISDIAYLMGNSIEVCMAHYIHHSRVVQLPKF